MNRGASYNFLGNYQQGLLDEDKAASLDASISWAYIERGWSYIGLANFGQALADLNKAAQLDPKNAAVYRMRVWAHYGLGSKRHPCGQICGIGNSRVVPCRPYRDAVRTFPLLIALK